MHALKWQWRELDLYGRRAPLADAVVGAYSAAAAAATTLEADILIDEFSAATVVDAGAAVTAATAGPRGVTGGEGHYGVSLVGSAQVRIFERYFKVLLRYQQEGGAFVKCARGRACCKRAASDLPPFVMGTMSGRGTMLSIRRRLSMMANQL